MNFSDALSGIDRYKLVCGVEFAWASCAVAPEKVLYEGKDTSYSPKG